ncbi:MAG: IPT/TIG domain-containing protein [Pyrinomonadaceae bacterium]
MPLFEGKTPAERNKLIAALAFGALALFLVGRMFFGSSDTPSRPPNKNNRNANARVANGATVNGGNGSSQVDAAGDPTLQIQRPVIYNPVSYNVPDPGRNIFAFYVAPVKTTATPAETVPPTPTPIPPPPLALNTISPASIIARTGDFALQLSGDKFTPQTRVYVDGQELPTTFTSAQQLSTNVPAALIAAPGSRQVVVRTPDNQLYSNPAVLNVGAPPTPSFTYIGLLGGARYNDKAILKNQSNELVTVQRGDLVGGRFKVTSISPRSVEFIDAQLQIKHTLPYVENRTAGGGSPNGSLPRQTPPPPPKTDDDDDNEPPN